MRDPFAVGPVAALPNLHTEIQETRELESISKVHNSKQQFVVCSLLQLCELRIHCGPTSCRWLPSMPAPRTSLPRAIISRLKNRLYSQVGLGISKRTWKQNVDGRIEWSTDEAGARSRTAQRTAHAARGTDAQPNSAEHAAREKGSREGEKKVGEKLLIHGYRIGRKKEGESGRSIEAHLARAQSLTG